MRKVGFLVIIGMIFSACSSASFSTGDVVLVEWFQNSWHKAKLGKECGSGSNSGFSADFEDNFYDQPEGESEVCYAPNSIIRDEAPGEIDIKVGMKVLGEWVADAFYNATITQIKNGVYTLKYDDDYTQEVDIQKLRLLPEGRVE